ncbi:MAG: MiaB/RimO family radical SAM methylthiotransferase, partial [Ruminococcus sp.]|nr:MiaB/RimO family radical SAM methylthiotransferase [Ruminococcus sp.]
KKVRKAIHRARRLNKNSIIVLTGCMAQAFMEGCSKIDEVDIVLGNSQKGEILEKINEFLANREKMVAVAPFDSRAQYDDFEIKSFCDRTRAFVKIEDGCNRFCSYCIIPYARGRCRSRNIESVRAEAENSAVMDKKEIVLTGINLAFYGREYGLNLADAVEVCAEVDGIERIRLGSLEPEMMSDDLLKRLSAVPQLCPQFHLSLQSGCTKILKAMNRHYTAEEYFNLTERIRKFFPECSFTTDIMVGFPSETDEDFRESLEFVEKVGFSRVHVFRYSRRKGTIADRMAEQIPENIKALRASEMSEMSARTEAEYMHSLVGKTVKVLFERENCTDFHRGYAADYTLIKIPRENSEKSLRNKIFCVTIEESRSDFCIGRIVNE